MSEYTLERLEAILAGEGWSLDDAREVLNEPGGMQEYLYIRCPKCGEPTYDLKTGLCAKHYNDGS